MRLLAAGPGAGFLSRHSLFPPTWKVVVQPDRSDRETPRDGEDNCFDLIRLLLAVLVVYSHAYLLGGFGLESFASLVRGQTIAGTLAVLGFFGVSGFLVTRSFALRSVWHSYLKARFLRIAPGYYFSLLVTAFLFAPLISSCNRNGASWHPAAAFGFIADNALLVITNWHVGDCLKGLPYEGSINGALWSLFPEFCCYLLVLVAGLLGWVKRTNLNVLLVSGLVAVLHLALVLSPQTENLAPTLFQLTTYTPFVTAFLTGSCIYCFREHLQLGGKSALGWLALTLILLKFGGWHLLGPLVLPFAIINLAHSFRVRLRYDLSYGIYIMHFPMLQLLAANNMMQHGLWPFLLFSLALTAVAALGSFVLIERPALKYK